MKLLRSIALSSMLSLGTSAWAGEVFRCEVGGRTAFSDTPCDVTKPANGAMKSQANTLSVTEAYDSPYGEWRGQAQFQASINGKRVESAHSVVQLVLRAAVDGKLTGVASESGCKLLGLVSPGFTPQMLNVDVTLKGCAHPDLNRRYAGSLVLSQRDKVARLQVHGVSVGIGTSSMAELSAVMRR